MNKGSYDSLAFRNSRGFLRLVFSNQCFICKKENSLIEIHHIDKNTNNNHLFNLVPLCLECHKIVHKSRVDLTKYPVCLIDEVYKVLQKLIDDDMQNDKVFNKFIESNKGAELKSYAFGHPLSDD